MPTLILHLNEDQEEVVIDTKFQTLQIETGIRLTNIKKNDDETFTVSFMLTRKDTTNENIADAIKHHFEDIATIHKIDLPERRLIGVEVIECLGETLSGSTRYKIHPGYAHPLSWDTAWNHDDEKRQHLAKADILFTAIMYRKIADILIYAGRTEECLASDTQQFNPKNPYNIFATLLIQHQKLRQAIEASKTRKTDKLFLEIGEGRAILTTIFGDQRESWRWESHSISN